MMKQLLKPDLEIIKIISRRIPAEGTSMRRSQFLTVCESEGFCLLFNTLTRECLLVENERIPDTFVISKKTMDDPVLCHMISNCFYVSDKADECSVYCGAISALRAFRTSDSLSTYTILSTTACNARCFYCYESGYKPISMSKETADKLIDFIDQTRINKTINLRWFGGEPLMNTEVMLYISKKLHEKGVPFRSHMITNGSLLSPVMLQNLDVLNLKKVQITLDGDREEYQCRKNYINTDSVSFDTVLDNIQALQQAGIKISIRLNVDLNNIASMEKLISVLEKRYPDKDLINIYAYPLSTEETKDHFLEIWQSCFHIESLAKASGFSVKKSYGIQNSLYYCMASNPQAVVIYPDGTIFSCEHCGQESRIGSITEGILKSRKKTVSESDIRHKCRNCQFLPICTDFSECPNVTPNKNKVIQLQLNHTLSELLAKTSIEDLPSL